MKQQLTFMFQSSSGLSTRPRSLSLSESEVLRTDYRMIPVDSSEHTK
jgi:hypothetical protein